MDYLKSPYNKLCYVPFHKIKIEDDFWSSKQKVNREVSIPLQFQKLEKDHHINNFRVAAGQRKGIHTGEFYFDSDLYKWLEAACYTLHKDKDVILEKKVNEIISLISNSQLKDGYINTFYSTKFAHKRFTNLIFMHELYCAGHLIEAAIAHYSATGSIELLIIAEKFATLIGKRFGSNELKEAPGHEEIELALIKLFRVTQNSDYLSLSKTFINNRGKFHRLKTYILIKYFNFNQTLKEAKIYDENFKKRYREIVYSKRGEEDEVKDFYADLTLIERLKFILSVLNGKCYQLNVPVRKIIEPTGHAVRAMYLYCGMADLYSETGDKSLLDVLKKIWLKIVKAKMFITGSIGSIKGIEGFEKDFKLKSEKSYSETCAAIGFIMWNWRMLNITGHCKYADLIERLLYNGMLAGYSIDGRKYFYRNPLISDGQQERQEWFLCACCPPNIARTIASLGNYIYSTSKRGIWIHQYIGCESEITFNDKIIKIKLTSTFPWKGEVIINLELEKNQKFSIFLRIPYWCNHTRLKINGEGYYDSFLPGTYIQILRNWINNDLIELNFKIVPKLIDSDPRIKNNRKKGVLSYGPLIYCLEEKDNKHFDIFSVKIPKNQDFEAIHKPNLLEGIFTIQGIINTGEKFTAIPYFAWNNRGPTKMQVWNKII